MALESSSPFGMGDATLPGTLPGGKPLFPDRDTIDTLAYPFKSSGNFTSVFNSTTQSNAVLNTKVGHSSPVDKQKIEIKSALLSPGFHDKVTRDSGCVELETNSDDKSDSHETTKSDITRSNISGDNGVPDYDLDNKMDEDDLSDNEDLVECGNCDNEYQSLQEYMDHTCAGNKSIESVKHSDMDKDRDSSNNSNIKTVKDSTGPVVNKRSKSDLSDVESFDGKIVYNPDGSAYIIEGDSDSDIESIIDLPQKEGVIIDRKGKNDEPSKQPFPLIDNAFFVPRNPNSFMNNTYMLPQQQTPIMHSYRVYDLRSGKHKSQLSGESEADCNNSKLSSPSSSTASNCNPESSTSETSTSSSSPSSSHLQTSKVTSVPTKPILMCFICKLSFGFSKSFISHASSEHSMVLTSKEHEIMSQKNSSAIIQGIGKDKEPLMSFLEPIKSSGWDNSTDSNMPNDYGSNKSNSLKETTSVSYVYTKPKLSESYMDSNFTLSPKHSKDLSIKDLKDQYGKYDGESQSSSTMVNSISNRPHFDNKDLHGISEIKKLKLDLSDSDSQPSFPVNPALQRFMSEDFKSQSPKPYLPPYSSSQRAGFYGMCEEHPNGRAQGVECPSCDMLLSSSQSLGGHMTMMHSRNSCKTLKCPKCNWHYKYQETLEIHMKEKHPEGDQKCMYCLTNQPHPRLARGESYSCGYKPYRCEVCNYSTTTKGNLSIHMQSDKHLNNVQELAHGNGDLAMQKHQVSTPQQQQQLSQPSTPLPAPSPAPTSKTPSQQQQQMYPPHQQASHPHQSAHQSSHQSAHQQSHIPQPHPSTVTQDHLKKNKPKPTWRCDVCNYETNVARNLRIHMTSEKHTHNMMVLQQNMKHMQRDMQLHQMNQLVMLQQDPSFMGLTGPIPGGITFPYDGSLMMAGMPPGFGEAPMDLSKENGVGIGPDGMPELQDVNRLFQCCVCNVFGTDSLESLHQHLQMDRTKMHEHENISVSNGTYMCNLCQYKTNLKANFQLHCKTDKHIQRLQLVNHIKEGGSNNEWRLKYLNVSNPVQVRCNACDYYTNSIHKLQIHTGNPRHEASAQLFCHLQSQDGKLSPTANKYYQCTLCKFNARSKLGLMQHVHSMQHLHSESLKQIEMKEAGQLEIDIGDIFKVQEVEDMDENNVEDEDGLGADETGVREHDAHEDKDRVTTPLSPSHTYNNNNNTIKHNPEDLSSKGDAKTGDLSYSPYNSTNEMRIKSHLLSQHTNNTVVRLSCPLCQEPFPDKSKVEKHLTGVHHVNSDGLHKLLALCEESPNAKMPPMTMKEATLPSRSAALAEICEINLDSLEEEATKQAAEDAIDLSQVNDVDKDEQFRCQTCSKSFSNIDQLYSHQNELGHLELKQTPRGPGYLCWKKGCNQYFKTAQALQMHFREIHAKSIALSSADKLEYKYPCQMCTLSFKSQQKLHIHAQLHIIKAAVTCTVCSKAFTSMSSLRHHVASSHDLSDSDIKQVTAEMYGNAMALATFITDPNLSNIFKISDSVKPPKNDINGDSITAKPHTNGDADSETSSKENSPSTTPYPIENGIDKLDDREEMDLAGKDDQAVEDYLNSQIFAEDYENPSRKYKCHRCRLAYTKQHYLTAHNRTLLHRKGEKLSYPMEKYLDPNRPYKCDICKESFTQHNILLVHYNSVSHLHKVKQIESGITTPTSSPSPQPASSNPSSMTSSNTDKQFAAKSREQSPEDDRDRPYKCNICKVSYSQGSTLDIHIRSVAHQTRASKLKELALSGEIDLTRPLIEEPMDKTVQAQQKMLNDMLVKQSMSQQSLLFPGIPGLTSYPGFPGLPSIPGLPMLPGLPPLLPMSLPNQGFSSAASSYTSSQALSSSSDKSSTSFTDSLSSTKALEKISQNLATSSQSQKGDKDALTVVTTSASSTQSQNVLSGNQESLNQHQTLSSGTCSSPSPGSAANKFRLIGRIKPAVQRNLLENFGFECVMQFNEFNQRAPNKRDDEASDKPNSDDKSNNPDDNGKDKEENDEDKQNNGDDDKKEDEDDGDDKEREVKVKIEPEEETKVDLPEMNRCVCAHCNKQFSSVWVLKAHKEEVHRDFVPLEKIEEFGDQFKADFEQSCQSIPVEVPEAPPTPVTPVPPVSTPVEEKVIKQEMPPPPPPPPTQLPPVDMLQMMNMFSMGMMHMPMPLLMNTQPSLMPMMMPPPGMDNVLKSPALPGMDTSPSGMMSAQQQKQFQNSAMANQKRARTRINDEQLKVLRGYFDINNSPSEDQINAMSEQTGLPQKVIKHWFRNTLFKERQRNKDSPYNFNNPPSTTLDLEEYEKTGKLTIIEETSPPDSKNPSPAFKQPEPELKRDTAEKTESPQLDTSFEKKADPIKHKDVHVKSVHDNKMTSENVTQAHSKSTIKEPHTAHHSHLPPTISSASSSFTRSVQSATVTTLSAISPSFSSPSMTSSIAHMPKLTPPGTNESIMQSFAHGLAAMNSPSVLSYPPKSTTPTSTPLYDNHNYSPPGGSSGRRANRTRFTDYQIKCLQEYFEQNAYPKDDELENLSKMLELSPRVIVVWFQNARQKARKIYENQPADNKETSSSSSTSPFSRTPGLNYQCKKCQSVFQRYYDLIRHQKRHCFTENEKQESQMMSDDSDSMSNVTSLDNTCFSDSESETSSIIGKSREANTSVNEGGSSKYRCEKCNMSFHHAELFKEHQALHSMNPGLFMNLSNNSAFGVLQSMANTSHTSSMDSQSPSKRKFEEEMDDSDQPRDKRLRTTILPEQLDYLYQKYQIDCNPSRKQLEAISKDVGLKKRVVQVWFQNTRARERKGQYRAHQQLIHKRCPICRALFRAKSALESHLATKHPDEMAKGEINIDAIPDATIESPGPSSSGNIMSPSPEFNNLLAPPGMPGLLPYMPPGSLGGMGFPPMADPIQMSMKQFYDDSFKKYISELSSTSHDSHNKGQPMLPLGMTSTPMKAESTVSSMEDDAPLDLSKPVKPSTASVHDHMRDSASSKSSSYHGDRHPRHERHNSGPSAQDILRSAVDQGYMMRRFNESVTEGEKTDEESSNKSSCPASPGPSMNQANMTNKRYRTQMTSLQVRVMKHIFVDYKTPTMAECEMLGRVIGLQKRVVQVWFQNARAKEKKAKLNMAKSYGQSELDFPKPPEECTLCNFKYSHKYTIQDHIFTKKHIDKVREFIQTRADAERELSTSSASISGVSGLLHSQQPNDIDHMRKLMEEANAQSQMAHLQSMGLGPLGLPSGAMAGLGLLNPSDYLGPLKKEEKSSSQSKDKSDSDKQNEGSSKKSSKSLSSAEAQLQSLNMLSPFGGMLPGMDPSMLPFMYPGLPGLMSGVPGVPPPPSLTPGLMPGAEHLLGYDPMTFGTPLPLLQIPQQAIKDVSSKLADPKANIGQYTQDCKSISSLRSIVSSQDYNCVSEATIDVGYICKKCQMVYPAKDACVGHQHMMCFAGGKLPEGVNTILKLEQIQYECKLCSDKMSTVQDFKSHCETDSHRAKLKLSTSSPESKHRPVSTPTQSSSS